MELTCIDLKDLPRIAEEIIQFAGSYKIWRFEGEMGAGKTTLIKTLSKSLKIIDNVNSPTFSIVNEYLSASDDTYYHFDFYRLDNEIEALDIGVEDYFYSGNICFLEWASQIESLMPEEYVLIKISVDEEERRMFELSLVK